MQQTNSKLFGRRKGRPLHVRKTKLVEELLPQLRIALEEGKQVEPSSFFGSDKSRQAWLEIGFGGGEHLAAQAKLHADKLFIGCEPFMNGVASLLDHIDREGLQNVRIFDGDARQVLDALHDASLDKCFVLFADPWPKTRHAERRFIGSENLDRIARVLKPGSLLRLASDHPTLIEWMRERMAQRRDFECVHYGEIPPADWVQTRYQQKAIEAGRTPIFMDYIQSA